MALLSLAVLAGIVFYLFREGLPVFASTGFLDFVFGTDWYPVGDQPDFEIGSLIAGSLAVTFLASLFAVPLGLMTAAYLSEVAANTTSEARSAEIVFTAGNAEPATVTIEQAGAVSLTFSQNTG